MTRPTPPFLNDALDFSDALYALAVERWGDRATIAFRAAWSVVAVELLREGATAPGILQAGKDVLDGEWGRIEALIAADEQASRLRQAALLARSRPKHEEPPPEGQIERPANATVGSPHTTRRSNKRQPSERWDLDH